MTNLLDAKLIMKKFITLTILILAFGLTQACKSSKVKEEANESFKTQLTVFQNGTEFPVKYTSAPIDIEKSEFSLRFYNKKYDSENKQFYSTQIAAFTDKSEFDKIKVGLSKTDLSCFEPGSGMATNRSGKYEVLIFNNNGHHYTFYENPDSKRLNLLDDSGKVMKFEFEINSVYHNDKVVKMTETDLSEFYIALLIDKNLDGIIDQGELNKLTIEMPQ